MVRFEGEVSRIQEVYLGVRIVAGVSLGTRRNEEGIVLAPDRQSIRVPEYKLIVT